MPNYKHVGRIKSNQKKVIVANRVIPGDADHALVVGTESLAAEEHDALINLVESDAGQSAYELSEAMARTRLPDGRIMLAAFHTTGKLQKVATTAIEMTPNNTTVIDLDELNRMVAQQKGVTVEDLALKDIQGNAAPSRKDPEVDAVETYTQPAQTDGVLTDEDLAAQYRSQADAMFKEAKRLREQAEELSPTKKTRTRKSAEEKVS